MILAIKRAVSGQVLRHPLPDSKRRLATAEEFERRLKLRTVPTAVPRGSSLRKSRAQHRNERGHQHAGRNRPPIPPGRRKVGHPHREWPDRDQRKRML